MTVEKARALQNQNPTTVYLTFDDGPTEGTTQVLDALKETNVKATFFINSYNLVEQLRYGNPKDNANALLRIVEEGHVLADHSYDHMMHNSDGPNNAYTDIDNDLR